MSFHGSDVPATRGHRRRRGSAVTRSTVWPPRCLAFGCWSSVRDARMRGTEAPTPLTG